MFRLVKLLEFKLLEQLLFNFNYYLQLVWTWLKLVSKILTTSKEVFNEPGDLCQ